MIGIGCGFGKQVLGRGAPGAPTGFAADTVTATGGEFSCITPVNTGSSVITGYNMYARTPQGSGAYVLLASSSTESFTIDDSLTTATAYDLYVTATNSQGESPPSNVIQVTTA